MIQTHLIYYCWVWVGTCYYLLLIVYSPPPKHNTFVPYSVGTIIIVLQRLSLLDCVIIPGQIVFFFSFHDIFICIIGPTLCLQLNSHNVNHKHFRNKYRIRRIVSPYNKSKKPFYRYRGGKVLINLIKRLFYQQNLQFSIVLF